MDHSPPCSWRAVYGSTQGDWLRVLAIGSRDVPPPAHIDGLAYLGSPYDVVQRAVKELGSQTALADVLLVKQQTVSRYLAGTAQPDLPSEGWRQLVLLAHPATERTEP